MIRIWAVESDYDSDAVGKLARKLINRLGHTNIVIQTVGKRTYNSVARRRRKNPNALKAAVEAYLEEPNSRVIFVLDRDSSVSLADRRQESNSAISQIERVVQSLQSTDRVYLAMAIEELEAWLLVDCVGICCYFARSRYSQNCREKVARNRNLNQLIKKYQKGDTELIVEAERGGAGAKEHLIKFSEEILRTLNPRIRHDTVDRTKYREALAPDLVEYIEVSKESLRRNQSLQRFCKLLLA